MTRKEQIEKAAQEYINSDAVNPMNMQLAFGDFINGAKWADCNPNLPMVNKMHDDLKTAYDMLNDMLEDYDDERLDVAYRFLGEVLEDLELLVDDEE